MFDMSKNIDETIILCGGLGTRFREVSEEIPKALAVVSGKSILSWLVDDLTNIGIKKIILATGYMSEAIEEFVEKNNLENCIISKEKNPLGTGGAIINAQKHVNKKNFFILNGDSRIKTDFKGLYNFHNKNNSDMSIILSSAIEGKDFGNVLVLKSGKINSFLEKNCKNKYSYINAGVYIISKDLLTDFEKNSFYSLEKDLIPKWIKERRVFGYVVDIPFTDIGTKERYLSAKFE